jgi:hypothetical protein
MELIGLADGQVSKMHEIDTEEFLLLLDCVRSAIWLLTNPAAMRPDVIYP